MDHLQDQDLLTAGMNEESKSHLRGIAQWTNINAIVGLISTALSVLSTVMTVGRLSRYSSSGAGSQVLGMIVTVALSLLLNLTLLSAAKNIKLGLLHSERGTFILGLSKLASYFKYLAILLIIVLVIFTLAMIIILIAGASTGFNRF